MDENIARHMVKKYGLAIAFSTIFLLFVVDIFFVTMAEKKLENLDAYQKTKPCRYDNIDNFYGKASKISEISGPTITSDAVSLNCSGSLSSVCADLGTKAWIFLLVVYVVLMVFNLGYGMCEKREIQWAWEIVITLIFIWFWFSYDECAQNIWYPLYVTKFGIAIYIAYLYFFFNGNKDNLKKPK